MVCSVELFGRNTRLRWVAVILLLLLTTAVPLLAQGVHTGQDSRAGLSGTVTDPSGAVVPGTTVTLKLGSRNRTAHSGNDGRYSFRNLPVGKYALAATAPGFAVYAQSDVDVGATQKIDIQLIITDAEQVLVHGETSGVSLDADQNGSATVIKGSDLDALSDDPTQLMNELGAFAGPSAGPGGGDMYVDGMSGGRLPPKSSIREIHINQNPYSAEFDHSGYGRVEILTKPGADKFTGGAGASLINSALNTAIPFSATQPHYYQYWTEGNIAGPLRKNVSFFADYFRYVSHNQQSYDAINPADPATMLSGAFAGPETYLYSTARLDMQLGKNNTLSVRGFIFRDNVSGVGVGGLNLPMQSSHTTNPANEAQVSDTIVLGPHVIDEINFQWKHERETTTPDYVLPTINVEGAFVTGGASANSYNYITNYELQNYATATLGRHVMRFGVRLRANEDAQTSTSGANGSYFFQTIAQYETKTPYLYTANVVRQPTSKIVMFDAATFLQDEWRVRSDLNLGLGLRLEGQNRIHDRANWAPRVNGAWSIGQKASTDSKKPAPPTKTVLRAGSGIFYQRFTIPSFFNGGGGTPYLLATIQNNGVNQASYVVQNPNFYDPTAAIPASELAMEPASAPTIDTLAPNFHVATNWQSSVELDRVVTKAISVSANYVYTRGVHQYLTNNITAQDFNPTTYTLTGAPPSEYNYQFQSGGVFRQRQLIITTNEKWKRVQLHTSYTYNHADGDTTGVKYFPSVAKDPGLDYGRASFGVTHQFQMFGTINAPWKIEINPLVFAQSGTPYNITIGNDLTGNNQSNARPTFGTCGAAGVVTTAYGCLDSTPQGKSETIIPYDLGTGPANVVAAVWFSRAVGVGPRKAPEPAPAADKNATAAKKTPELPERKYSLRFEVGATNVFNTLNLAPPNGVMSSPLFGKTQSVAGGPFSLNSPGNRTILLMTFFNF
jgi:hypothetical protein